SRRVMSLKLKSIGLLAALALTVASCSADPAIGEPSATTTTPVDPGPLAAPTLAVFDACDSFLDYVKTNAIERVGPYGLDNPDQGWWGGRMFAEDGAEQASSDTTAAGGDNFSGTNVQVLGVDEPDMVKTDGERIVVLSEGMLIVADVTGPEPVITGRLHLGSRSVQSLFLSGDRVLLFGSLWTSFHPLAETDASFAPQYQAPSMELVEIDISGEPEIVSSMTIDGRFISGRMVGDTIRLVSSSGPVGLEWSFPEGTGLRAEQRAIEANKEIIRRSTPDNWIPYYIVSDANGRTTDQGTLFDCNRAAHPEEFAGLNMLSVVTIDLGDGLAVIDSTGVLANGSTVYASAENLYVATQNWETWRWGLAGIAEDQPETVTTDIHKFDISDPSITTYLATGTVEGYLLNQFAMDEHNGHLRVASTTSPSWWGSGFETESLVTVLADSGEGRLSQVGSVDGLGKTEQIYSVRFLGDMAYVVTFRQTDPLYTLDLSNPSAPEVVGELKILGYSAYLHPVSDGLLLGIGQDATETGQVQGTQVSLFDVSDPANPTRLDQITLSEGSSSQVEYDHHAFLYWEPTGMAMVPVQQWFWDKDKEDVFFGAVGFKLDGRDLSEVRRFAHPGGDSQEWDWRAQITRSIVIGDRLYSISNKGIMSSDLATLDELSFLGF
ncbi:MAG: beta-propeller domain-containing protein, partial [Acidimicrobiia bacterium]